MCRVRQELEGKTCAGHQEDPVLLWAAAWWGGGKKPSQTTVIPFACSKEFMSPTPPATLLEENLRGFFFPLTHVNRCYHDSSKIKFDSRKVVDHLNKKMKINCLSQMTSRKEKGRLI